MRILKIHFFAQFQKSHISGTAFARKVKFSATKLFYSVLPHVKFGEDSRTWVDISQKKI